MGDQQQALQQTCKWYCTCWWGVYMKSVKNYYFKVEDLAAKLKKKQFYSA
jgi:hypothetical protein